MEQMPQCIAGCCHTDQRGTICFINDFDMSEVKRFYRIIHPDITVIRGWRGHQIERRWFSVTKGSFKISLVKIEKWVEPDRNSQITHFELHANQNQVLEVPAGYASALQAISEHSEILVFADYGIEHAKLDDHLYPADYFKNSYKK